MLYFEHHQLSELMTSLILCLFRNPVISGKKPNPVLRPTNGGGDAQYEVVTIDTTSHVPPSIPPTDGDIVYEQIH